tara:strand:+ start:414 stop:821 length:408 start_codon:yes stop_codon:yes gene_type:complete
MPSIFEGDWTTPRPRASAPMPEHKQVIYLGDDPVAAMRKAAKTEVSKAAYKNHGNMVRDNGRRERAQKVLNFIAANQPTNGAAILDALGIPEKSMQSYASLLLGEGLIELQNRSETPLGRTDWVLGTYTLKTDNP